MAWSGRARCSCSWAETGSAGVGSLSCLPVDTHTPQQSSPEPWSAEESVCPAEDAFSADLLLAVDGDDTASLEQKTSVVSPGERGASCSPSCLPQEDSRGSSPARPVRAPAARGRQQKQHAADWARQRSR